MANIFHQEHGDVVEIVAAADISANDIIALGTQVGVALASCLSGERVNIKLTGVIKVATGDDLSAGDIVTANVAPTNTFTTAGGVAAKGVVVEDNNAGATVLVRLTNG